MSSTSNRVAAKQYFRDLFAAGLTNVAVDYSFPRSGSKPRHLYFGGIRDASFEIPALQSGRKQREDHFIIDVAIDVYRPGDNTSEQADLDVEAIWADVDSILADSSVTGQGPKLGGNVTGLLGAVIDKVDGPHPYVPKEPNGSPMSGYASAVILEIACVSRYD